MEIKKILKTYLFMYYGIYPPSLSSKICIFFLRTTPGTVTLPMTMGEAIEIMPQFFDFGILNSHPLFMLSQMLNKMYNPLLSYRGDQDETLLPKFAIKDVEETDQMKKLDDEKIIRVIFAV